MPGHVRFLKNMLAGVGAVDACLFVVAATEGWKPQSEEHLRILELLGVTHGLVALTKVGLVDEELAASWLASTSPTTSPAPSSAGAAVVQVDAPSRRGIDDLKAALDELLAETPTAADRRRPRLLDRPLVRPKGAGTVVTGTLAGGLVADRRHAGGRTEPASTGAGPAPATAGRRRQRVGAGNRVAVNLSGVVTTRWLGGTGWSRGPVAPVVDHRRVARGPRLARPPGRAGGRTSPTSGRASCRSGCGCSVADAIEPGGHGLVRLRLPGPLPLLPGDRFVLREAGRSETIGGGEILDVARSCRRRRSPRSDGRPGRRRAGLGEGGPRARAPDREGGR